MTRIYCNLSMFGFVIPNLIGNRNALIGFVGCFKIPACAGKTAL